ncbi:sodium:solute symporter family transporter [Sciscionella sediminilitoris]|uniref:sodium:solute symporter family transporter n=1 Tax=Sciscionella sediminilitoris TaxID=1445613 RepID=UPI0004DEF507|nr:sodium:solute symporter [Sciscionella sp. SE31]
MGVDYLVIALYILGMLAIGWLGTRLARTRSDFIVAGRRLGTTMYSGTMAAVVLGGASTIGSIGLGYTYGISGAWLVIAIGLGLLLLHAVFVRRIVRLRVYTVAEMLRIRYGHVVELLTAIVMWAYTLMVAVTSVLSFATVFAVLFALPSAAAIALGGAIVVLYSTLGGMWSITITDIVQFGLKTIGIFVILLPIALTSAGGLSGIGARLGEQFLDPVGIGGAAIGSYLLTYALGLLIGQDIWQRAFTARSPKVATTGGLISGTYCLLYAIAGAVIGAAGHVLYPKLGKADDAFAVLVENLLPTGLRGLVLAAALSALMSTSSGALLACATVASNDLLPRLRTRVPGIRMVTLAMGVLMIGLALSIGSVVGSLNIAYNLLVGGLLVAILGALVWPRATAAGAIAGILAGSATVVVTMIVKGVLADEPIYYGLGVSLLAYVTVSLATRRTDRDVLAGWRRRMHEGATS